MINPSVYLKTIPGKGRGVFANKLFPKGTLIESAPVIVIPYAENKRIWEKQDSFLDNYYFQWDSNEKKTCALALGYGSLYNHSYYPNAIYLKDYKHKLLKFMSIDDIYEGEEITINYNGDPRDKSEVWFEAK